LSPWAIAAAARLTRLKTEVSLLVRERFIKLNLMVSTDCEPTSTPGIRVLVKHSGSFPMSNTSVDAGTANGYEQSVNKARIAILVAIALPVFGGLCYALLHFLLFG
jgi:hypothetical protein